MSALRSEFPALKILVVSGTDDLALVRNAFNAGADGFLPKTSDPSELLAPLQVLADGGSVLPKRVLSSLLAYAVRPSLALPHLDSNDVRLLRTLASGVALDEVAAEFLVSERTAKADRRSARAPGRVVTDPGRGAGGPRWPARRGLTLQSNGPRGPKIGLCGSCHTGRHRQHSSDRRGPGV